MFEAACIERNCLDVLDTPGRDLESDIAGVDQHRLRMMGGCRGFISVDDNLVTV
jgi:hypothetical protein